MNNTKSIAASKTAWFAIAVVALGLLEKAQTVELPEEVRSWALPVIGVMILVLRWVTKSAVKL